VYWGLYFPSGGGIDCAKCVYISIFLLKRLKHFFDEGLTAVRHSVCAAARIHSDSNDVNGS
jgi:hypothetical protein